LFYELINQIKEIETLECLSVEAFDRYFDYEENEWRENNASNKWSKDVKCDKGLVELGTNIKKLNHLKELDLNLAG